MLTIENYKSYAGINTTNQDASLAPLVAYVNDFVSKYCDLQLEEKVVEGEIHTLGNGTIILDNNPVKSIESVDIEGIPLDAERYRLDNLGMLVLKASRSAYWTELSINYTAGYSELPAGLAIPMMELITYFQKKEFNKSASIGATGESLTFMDPKVVPPHIRAGLDLYRYG